MADTSVGPTIRIYEDNPYYWTLDGEPTLLLGGSPKDNLYQHVGNPEIDLKADLDRLVSCGGNYVRHTMQSRVNDDREAEFIVQPFATTGDGLYDLEAWNGEYWERLEKVLKWTAERDIVMQVTFWDRFDFSDHANRNWRRYNAWNPKNNITYTTEETGLPTEWSQHPAMEVFPFMRSVKEGNELLLEYQEKYVNKVLSCTLEYDHILYNISNETRAPKSWGDYWADFTHERATETECGPVYVTQMYEGHGERSAWDITQDTFNRIYEDRETYDYVDVSQNNNWQGGNQDKDWSDEAQQGHYDNLITVREKFRQNPWPINNEKCYGQDGGRHGHTSVGLDRFWRAIFGGSASIRFHRPPSGLGISETARTHIEAMRNVTDELDLATTDPRNDLLTDRNPNEAFCLTDGAAYLVTFLDGGDVTLDVELPDSTTVEWYDVETACWAEERDVTNGPERLSTPDDGRWVAVVRE